MKIAKIISITLLFLLIVALPAGSWLFLKDGFNWRKDKLEELSPKGLFLNSFSFTPEEKTKIFEETTYKTTVVKLNEDLSKDDMSMIDQYRKSKTFLFLVLSEEPIIHEEFSSKQPLRYITSSNLNANTEKLRSANYVLLDTAGVIRQFYNGTDNKTLTSIVEDVAIVLPRKITPDIEMKKTRE
jgi:hypothetical protein